MESRTYWLLGGLAALVAVWVYSRSQTDTDVVSSVIGGVVSTIRGIRNNNPGNMVYDAAITWQGQTGQDASGFLTFDTMTNGIRAMAINLRNYEVRDGLSTVDAIIRRWSKTDQDAYVANVAAALGVDPQESIDLSDTGTLTALIAAIIRQEDSAAGEALVDSQIAAGVAAA